MCQCVIKWFAKRNVRWLPHTHTNIHTYHLKAKWWTLALVRNGCFQLQKLTLEEKSSLTLWICQKWFPHQCLQKHADIFKKLLCHWVKIWFHVDDNVIRFWIDKHVSADKIRANVSEDVFFNLESFLSMHLNSPFKCPHCGSIYLKRSRHLFQMQRYYSNFKWPDIESFELVK